MGWDKRKGPDGCAAHNGVSASLDEIDPVPWGQISYWGMELVQDSDPPYLISEHDAGATTDIFDMFVQIYARAFSVDLPGGTMLLRMMRQDCLVGEMSDICRHIIQRVPGVKVDRVSGTCND